MNITSIQNPLVKNIIKLRNTKKYRQSRKLILVEGWDEITLAIAAGQQPESIIVAPEFTDRNLNGFSSDKVTVNRKVFEKLSYRENPDGWLAVFPMPQLTLKDIRLSIVPLIVITEALEKPGNLGAILRTSDAAGIDALLVCDQKVDLYNPNVVRASRGTLFSVPTLETTNEEALSFLRDHQIRTIATTPHTDTMYTQVDLQGPVALAVGSEDEGLTDFWLKNSDFKVKIPMYGKVNSLNVSTATALIVYEALRQRKKSG